jgi:hypothetical protein
VSLDKPVVSIRELDEASARLSTWLAESGVGAEGGVGEED